MKKKYLTLFILFFSFIFLNNQFVQSKSIYKIPETGAIDSPRVPIMTPKKPSKAAKLKKTEEEGTTQDNKKSSSEKIKSEEEDNSYNSYNFKQRPSQNVLMYNKINLIGEKLLASNNIRRDVAFTLSSSYQANAYTNRHNQITINKGIIRFAENDDEMAAVIAHELGHVLNKDVKRTIRNKVLGTILVLSAPGAAGKITVGTGSLFAVKKLSRNMEYSADIAAVDILVNAGYNPLAVISMTTKITDYYTDILSTHPSGRKRLMSIYSYIETNYPQYIEEGYPTLAYKNALRIISKD